jgi:salicylate hydroxylase
VPASALPASFAEPIVWLWLSPGAHVVHYPVARGELINLVAIFRDDWRAQGWNVAADASQLPKTCETWSGIPRLVIAAAKSFGRWPLADRQPQKKWGDGRVTLIGDAAHPMLPFLAQGAAAAFEDAVMLGRHVRQSEDVAAAFRGYEADRAQRAARLQSSSRLNARIYHARGPLRWARDLKLRWDAEKIIARHDWIYRYGAV